MGDQVPCIKGTRKSAAALRRPPLNRGATRGELRALKWSHCDKQNLRDGSGRLGRGISNRKVTTSHTVRRRTC